MFLKISAGVNCRVAPPLVAGQLTAQQTSHVEAKCHAVVMGDPENKFVWPPRKGHQIFIGPIIGRFRVC